MDKVEFNRKMKTAIIVGLLLFATSSVNALPSVDEYKDKEVEISGLPNNQRKIDEASNVIFVVQYHID